MTHPEQNKSGNSSTACARLALAQRRPIEKSWKNAVHGPTTHSASSSAKTKIMGYLNCMTLPTIYQYKGLKWPSTLIVTYLCKAHVTESLYLIFFPYLFIYLFLFVCSSAIVLVFYALLSSCLSKSNIPFEISVAPYRVTGRYMGFMAKLSGTILV